MQREGERGREREREGREIERERERERGREGERGREREREPLGQVPTSCLRTDIHIREPHTHTCASQWSGIRPRIRGMTGMRLPDGRIFLLRTNKIVFPCTTSNSYLECVDVCRPYQ